MMTKEKRGRRAIEDRTEVHFRCSGDLADYAFEVMRERRLLSIADAWRMIAAEHREWSRRRTSTRIQ